MAFNYSSHNFCNSCYKPRNSCCCKEVVVIEPCSCKEVVVIEPYQCNSYIPQTQCNSYIPQTQCNSYIPQTQCNPYIPQTECITIKNTNITINNSTMTVSFIPSTICLLGQSFTVRVTYTPPSTQELTQLSPNYTFTFILPTGITSVIIQISTGNCILQTTTLNGLKIN